METTQSVLELNGITKCFGSLIANDNINLTIQRGTIHAIVGENGAGKSTLMNVVFGMVPADKGKVLINGRVVKINNPLEAVTYGIGMVHQHFKLFDSLTVAENVVLGNEPVLWRKIFDYKKSIKEVTRTAEKYDFKINPTKRVGDLSVGQRQNVEILKVLYRNVEILLLDEPTSVLTPPEVDQLFNVLRKMVEDGKTIILVTHKMREVFAISDYVTIMRRGKKIGTFKTKEVTEEQVCQMMVNKTVIGMPHRPQPVTGNEVLSINNLTCRDDLGAVALKQVDINVHQGEVVGIAGVSGNGQSELVSILAGSSSFESGEIKIRGKDLPEEKPRDIREIGVGLIPEDRGTTGLSLPATIEENLILNNYYQSPFSKVGVINSTHVKDFSNNLISEFDIRTTSSKMAVASLSGGNQQKVALAREMCQNPSLLVVHEPTRGLDVAATEFVYAELISQVESGSGVLLVSTNLDEILQLSDRIYVLYNGSVVAEFSDVRNVSEQEIGLYMLGLKTQENAL
jgi:ABC-type uncharacterized transport system ATPase subunit